MSYPKTLVVDNFLPAPHSTREEFVTTEFKDVLGPDGETYKRVAVRPNDEFQDLLEKALGKKIKMSHAMVRLNYAGENPNNAIHSDSGYNEWAVVLYLNLPEQCQGGTALWEHKIYNWKSLPTEAEVRAQGRNPTKVLARLRGDWNEPDAWKWWGMLEMKFNRAVIFPCAAFHSRYPFEAFGTTPDDGRLVWVTFFNVLPD